MILSDGMLKESFSKLTGLPAWGLVRTYGSMFFLEIGSPLPRSGEKKVHGEWHFLVEMCAWRIEARDGILISSENEPAYIDSRFRSLELGQVTSANVQSPSYDLDVSFTSGLLLKTMFSVASPGDRWTQWQLYGPDDYVWAVDEKGVLVYENAHQ